MGTRNKKILSSIGLLTLVALSAGMTFAWRAASNWQSSHKIDTTRTNSPEALLIVALDTRSDGTGGLPDSFILTDWETGKVKLISRDWSHSLLSPEQTLVEKYLGHNDCQIFCGIQGLFMYSQASEGGQLGALGALDLLRAAVEVEYGIKSLAIVAFDLTWAKSFLKCIAPVEIEVISPIPVGGKPVNGTLVDFTRYIPAGVKPLHGEDLFWFARSRFGSSNLDRMKRQEKLILALLEQKSVFSIAECVLNSDGFLATDLDLFDAWTHARRF